MINLTSRALIFPEPGKILLCENLVGGYFVLPGGHVETGESAKTAVIREVQEEFGLVCSASAFVGIFEQTYQSERHSSQVQDYTFLFELIDGCAQAFRPQQMEPEIKPVVVAIDELENLDFRPAPLIPMIKRWADLRAGKIKNFDPYFSTL